jgi:hypothetical protein
MKYDMIAKLSLFSPRREHFRENILSAIFIMQKCPSKLVPASQPFDASYTPACRMVVTGIHILK